MRRVGNEAYHDNPYHPQSSRQTESYNRTVVSRLRHYTGKYQNDWDKLVHVLMYAYNAQTHSPTNETPFSLALTRQAMAASRIHCPSVESSIRKASLKSQEIHTTPLDRINLLRTESTEVNLKARRRYKTNSDRMVRQFFIYDKGSLVCLRDDLPRRDDNLPHKLKPRNSGLFLAVVVTTKPSQLRKTEFTTLSILTECQQRGTKTSAANLPVYTQRTSRSRTT